MNNMYINCSRSICNMVFLKFKSIDLIVKLWSNKSRVKKKIFSLGKYISLLK